MKIIVANWKMNHGFKEIDEWLDGMYKIYSDNFAELQNYSLILCPPAIFLDYLDSELIEDGFKYLEVVAQKNHRQIDEFTPEEISEHVLKGRPIRLGAQDCHFEVSGAFTGELSAKMLRNVGCEYVILGHSERRNYNQESDELIEKKVRAAIQAGLAPIVCIGEDAEAREQKSYFEFLKRQLVCSIPCDIKIPRLIIAYEPIWSIGTGNAASIGQINEIMNFISRVFANEMAGVVDRLQLLYGGSVNPNNSKEILEIEKLDGLLVGKASLDIYSFLGLCPKLSIDKSNIGPLQKNDSEERVFEELAEENLNEESEGGSDNGQKTVH